MFCYVVQEVMRSQMRVLCVLTLCGDAPGYALVRLGNRRVLEWKQAHSDNLLSI